MLPRRARLTSPNDFSRATKSGFRFTSSSLVTYLYLTGAATPARAGLIISKNAGGSVVRHSIARQLRHALRQYLINLPDGSLLVIRALPSAIKSDLRQELSEAIPFLLEKTKVAK